MSQCRKFAPNIFNKSKCSNCFRQKEEHSAEALECNRASRAVARSGYLFVAPDWDFSVPLNRTKRWQRRWFVLYDDGELNYSVDEHPDTVPQGSVDMCKVMEVTGAEQVTGHPHSLALTSPDRVTFIKAASREDARWWAELLAVFPRRHKRNATFPGGRASPSLPQLGRSASPQPPRPRHLSCTGPSPRTNFLTPPLKEERESPSKEESPRPIWLPEPSNNVIIEPPPSRTDYIVSSGSPPTRDKLQCDEKSRARRDWRNERLRDIATALTDRSPESSLALPSEGLLHLKKGWLWLKAEDGDWLKYWWILCGPTLSGFRDQDEQGTAEVTVELSSVTSFNETTTDTRYGFQIHWSGSTLTLSAVTAGTRTNWLQALKKAIPDTPDSPLTPATPRSLLLSSDEEYRTASEGGRRGSGEWNELPPSPPLTRTALNRVKERARARPRLPRSQSRQSTVDSVSTDELDTAKEGADIELRNTLNKKSAEIDELKKQLCNAVGDVQNLESELARLKKIQSESLVRKKQTDELLVNLQETERELNQRIRESDEKHIKEHRTLQRRLTEAETLAKDNEDRCNHLAKDLQSKQFIVETLQDELKRANDRYINDYETYKKEFEGKYGYKRLNSLTDLTDIDLDANLENATHKDLIEKCLDLRSRFEKAVIEIRLLKKELRDAFSKYDDLELQNVNLRSSLEIAHREAEANSALMASRLQDLTNKLFTAEKQARSLKSKLQDSREKRRSLSLKGRESVSINKEVEDKVNELEAKILVLEKSRCKKKHKQERNSERASPIDDRSSPGQRSLRRLRRKSLDSATTSEPMKLLIRLSSLETKVSSVATSSESLNTITPSPSETNLKQSDDAENDKINRLKNASILEIRDKISECLANVSKLKNGRSKRAASPSVDRLSVLENHLYEINDILNSHKYFISNSEADVIDKSVGSVVKQLETLLRDKLNDMAEKKRILRQNGKLDSNMELCILAEKMAYENVLINRIREALHTPTTTDIECDRLLNKELEDTSHLITSLQDKLRNCATKQPPLSKTSVEYLTKILAKCLLSAAHGFASHKKTIRRFVFAPAVESLKRKQMQVNAAFNTYKTTKLPQLAEALASETINLASDTTCRLRGLDQSTVNEAWSTAQESVNAELIQSEINHILMRAAQVYEASSSADHSFFFSFFASERAALELWSDAVEDYLHVEMQKNIDELSEFYLNSLNKLQRQNWRRRVESERIGTFASNLLNEFADIIAHKALIDARISVLSGEFKQTVNGGGDVPDSFIVDLYENNKLYDELENSGLVQINQSLVAEFKCMLDNYSEEFRDIVNQFNLNEVVASLQCLEEEICKMLKCSDTNSNFKRIHTWQEVCRRCQELQGVLANANTTIKSGVKISENDEERRRLHVGTEYQTQVENLRSAYRRLLATNITNLQQSDLEQLQILCERVLLAMEHGHRRTLQDLRENHSTELQVLRQEKEQALAEETQATLAALDAMRKAHEAEVQREVIKFKQEFTRQQQNELLDLTERLSVKCLEAAALEEQLGSTTRQLAHAQQHILQLERNPQLSGMQN
ncbi:hypothetical protein RN001_008508 [Aquatica leii]|uniref:PH domain-containing protein n=1 Tax=Aquatica leii TaxID=1421715 RepID=A0AAN7P9Q6_9COLE|nr:hypothetical protein RN001_008508 [Aquatica leii]